MTEQDGKELISTQEWNTSRVHQKMSRCKCYYIVRFVEAILDIYNQIFLVFDVSKNFPYFMMVDWIWVSLLPTGPAWCYVKRECQPDETKNNMIRRDQQKPRRSKDKVKISLLIL